MNKKLQKYDFTFNLGDKVKIKPLDIKGKIIGIFITKEEITYRCKYYFNSEEKTLYFESEDLELIDNINDNTAL